MGAKGYSWDKVLITLETESSLWLMMGNKAGELSERQIAGVLYEAEEFGMASVATRQYQTLIHTEQHDQF